MRIAGPPDPAPSLRTGRNPRLRFLFSSFCSPFRNQNPPAPDRPERGRRDPKVGKLGAMPRTPFLELTQHAPSRGERISSVRAVRAGGGPSNAPCAQGDPFEGPGADPTEGLRRGMTLEKIARTLVGGERRVLDSRKDNESVPAFRRVPENWLFREMRGVKMPPVLRGTLLRVLGRIRPRVSGGA